MPINETETVYLTRSDSTEFVLTDVPAWGYIKDYTLSE
jgi:hypothetical protein